MSWASDDLASILVAPEKEFAGWGQGIIKSWDPDTFESVISYRGGELPNLPVASGVEALTYQPGDVVMLSRWQPTGGGSTTLRIGAGGRVIVPGSGAAAKTVQFMQTALARQIGAEVFADRVKAAEVSTTDTTASTTFTDLSSTVGPTITDVQVDSGTVILFINANILQQVGPGAAANSRNALASVEVTGATSVSPDSAFARSQFTSGANLDGVSETISVDTNAARVAVLTGLNAGLHTFTMKYRSQFGSTENFGLRALVVIAL